MPLVPRELSFPGREEGMDNQRWGGSWGGYPRCVQFGVGVLGGGVG